MPRASSSPNLTVAADSASGKNVSTNACHSETSCSAPAYQHAFRPVTRSMTRIPPAIAVSPDVKKGVDNTNSRRRIPDACFSIQSAASRPTLTRARTPHGVTKSAWKPLTQPAVLSEELKRASTPTTNPTAKRFRVASSQAATNLAAKANQNVSGGKKNRNKECVTQGDQLACAVIPSPPKKLQSGKGSSDVVSRRKSTIRSQGAKLAAPLHVGKLQTEFGKHSANVLAEVASASTNDVSQSVVPLFAKKLQLETAKNSNVITEAIASGTSQANQSVAPVIAEAIAGGSSQVNQSVGPVIAEAIASVTGQVNQLVGPVNTEAIASETSQVNLLVAPVITEATANRRSQANQLVAPVITEAITHRRSQTNQVVAPVITLPKQHLRTGQKFTRPTLVPRSQASGSAAATGPLVVPVATSQASGSAAGTGPLVVPKLQIGNMRDSSNAVSNPAYMKALLIKQQEQLLQQYKLASSQPQLHIKGPALYEDDDDDDEPMPEPLGTRCGLCKFDVAFRTQGGSVPEASAPPVVAVLACHHAFHSSCIEAVYGITEPSQCIACVDSATAH